MDDNPRLFSFVGSDRGRWRVTDQATLKGDPMPMAAAVDVRNQWVSRSDSTVDVGRSWVLHGVTSNERYVTGAEKRGLLPIQPDLGRGEATSAVMIPMRKNSEWWSLPQDERRNIFVRSRHNDVGMKALPAIARRLHHCRDLATSGEFDFVTWFEFAPDHRDIFNQLIDSLRTTEEWSYVDHEIEIRMDSAT